MTLPCRPEAIETDLANTSEVHFVESKQQSIYVLKLIPERLPETHWTEQEESFVERHFAHLQDLLKDGQLVLAGKTDGLPENTFGIVILEVDSREEARAIMEHHPAVAEGIMKAELSPYRNALARVGGNGI